MKPARFDGIVTRARLPETSRVHVRIHKSLAISRLRRALLAILLAMAVVAATAASVGAQWPTACVDLNDIVERHLGNNHNVGIYQRTFGDLAEDACQSDHLEDVRRVFTWAFGGPLTPTPAEDAARTDIGGWPTTCVELNDIVERHLGNENIVGIYQRTFADYAESVCRIDHREDVKSAFAWASSCIAMPNIRPHLAASSRTPHDEALTTVGELAYGNAKLRPFLSEMPWLACHVFPWLTDGVSPTDFAVLEELLLTVRVNKKLAMHLTDFAWFTDGPDFQDPFRAEQVALARLRQISQTQPDLLNIILSYSWITDDMTNYESSVIHDLTNLSNHDPILALTAATAPWITDGILRYESGALYGLLELSKLRPQLARHFLANSLTPPIWASTIRIMSWLPDLRGFHAHRFEFLVNQPWFEDGLDSQEGAFTDALVVAGIGERYLFNDLLTAHHTQSTTISTSLTGQIRLSAFQPRPFPHGEDLLRKVEEGIRGAERFMKISFPINDVIVILGGIPAGHSNHRLRLARYGQNHISSDLIYREMAKFYFTYSVGPHHADNEASPEWLRESGAELIRAYIQGLLGAEHINEQIHVWAHGARVTCVDYGLENLHKLTIPDPPDTTRWQQCSTLFGRYLLIRLFEILGEDTMSSALREIYLTSSHDGVRRNEEGILRPSEGDVYEIILKHTPPARRDLVRVEYRRIHGGPFIDLVD